MALVLEEAAGVNAPHPNARAATWLHPPGAAPRSTTARTSARARSVELSAVSAGACASRLRPNAMENMLPPIMGASDTKPQFSEKCAADHGSAQVRRGRGRRGRTETEPLDRDGGEEPEEAAVREAEQRAAHPEVVDVIHGVDGELGENEGGCYKRDTQGTGKTEVVFRRIGDQACVQA